MILIISTYSCIFWIAFENETFMVTPNKIINAHCIGFRWNFKCSTLYRKLKSNSGVRVWSVCNIITISQVKSEKWSNTEFRHFCLKPEVDAVSDERVNIFLQEKLKAYKLLWEIHIIYHVHYYNREKYSNSVLNEIKEVNCISNIKFRLWYTLSRVGRMAVLDRSSDFNYEIVIIFRALRSPI